MTSPVPENEPTRLAVLHGLDIVGLARNPAIEAICKVAAAAFRVPIAYVSLVDADRQWFAAECGLGIEGTARDVALCAHTIMSDAVMVVPDARLDPRFAKNPLVTGWPHIVFYAGAPLLFGAGIRIGTLCLVDTRPRDFTGDDVTALEDLADRVAGEIWALSMAREAAQ